MGPPDQCDVVRTRRYHPSESDHEESDMATTYSNMPMTAAIPSAADIEAQVRQAAKRRQILVISLRILLLVVFLGTWEIATRTGVIDPFFFAMPSGIAEQIWSWITEGTSQGPLWQQMAVTLEETLLGFLIGAV